MNPAAAISFLVVLAFGSVAAACIPGGDETAINGALHAPGDRAVLCPGAVFQLKAPVALSAPGQELSTEGAPEGARRAVLRVVGPALATAIQSRASHISIHHLIVDGARPALGRIAGGGALIELGGEVTGISVDHVAAHDPRGWSALHIFEGARNCAGARITHNVLGPAGAPDGAWADGISFACREGLIAHNTIIDASDGGIVIFGAPGTVVEDNTIISRKGVLLGGVNLVDFAPFAGDYSGVVVRNNRIQARGGFIKVAIAIGPGAWGIGAKGIAGGAVNRGGSVTDNVISGPAAGPAGIGYGIAMDGARDFTVLGNRVTGALGGIPGPRCDRNEAPPGLPLVRDPATTSGHLQPGFREGHIRYAICVQAAG